MCLWKPDKGLMILKYRFTGRSKELKCEQNWLLSAVWPDIGIKTSQMYATVAQKEPKAVTLKKRRF